MKSKYFIILKKGGKWMVKRKIKKEMLYFTILVKIYFTIFEKRANKKEK